MRDPTEQLMAEAACAALGHTRCEEVTFDEEVTRLWCPHCGADLTDENEEAPDGGSD